MGDRIRKNLPELTALLTRGMPAFVWSPRPGPLVGGVPVFCYHLVAADRFEADLRFIVRNGYQTLDADALLAYQNGRLHLSEPAIVLSFDDGSCEFHRIVYPLLCKHRQRAVFFIAAGLHRRAAQETAVDARPCTWEELREMHASGWVDVQSHTWCHRSLTRWPALLSLTGIDPALQRDRAGAAMTLEADLRRSRALIEERLEKSVRHLALPRYLGSRAALAAARAAGYAAIWRGVVPFRPLNTPGRHPGDVVRISGEFLLRLPGTHRRRLHMILRERYRTAARAMRKGRNPDAGRSAARNT